MYSRTSLPAGRRDDEDDDDDDDVLDFRRRDKSLASLSSKLRCEEDDKDDDDEAEDLEADACALKCPLPCMCR